MKNTKMLLSWWWQSKWWFIGVFFIGVIIISTLTKDPVLNQKIVYEAALKVFNGNKVMAELTLAQAILESGLNKTPSLLALKYNNLFGIKGKGTRGTITLNTTEYIKDKKIITPQPFAWNNTIEDSLEQRKRVLENGTRDYPTRYQPVLRATTIEQGARALKAGGWATDPNYPNQLIAVYKRYIEGKY